MLFFLFLYFVHTQISFPWSLQFGTRPGWKDSQVLMRAGLVSCKYGLPGISRGECCVLTLYSAL